MKLVNGPPLHEISLENQEDMEMPAFSFVQRCGMPLVHWNGISFRGIGSCFAISSHGLFLTARHNIEESFPRLFARGHCLGRPAVEEDGSLYVVYVERTEDDRLEGELTTGLCQVGGINFYDKIDIALFSAPKPECRGKTLDFSHFTLDFEVPSLNDECLALGYPQMNWNPREGAQDRLAFNVYQSFRASRGKVEELHLPERDKFMVNYPAFRTSAPFHPGMSGGPVFSLKTGGIIGVVSTSIRPQGLSEPFTSYAALITPAAFLRHPARSPDGIIRPHYVWDFIQAGSVVANWRCELGRNQRESYSPDR